MNRYHLVHVTDFLYDGPVSDSYNEVRLQPIDDDKQSCISFRLTTSPASRSTAHRDAFGNWVHQFCVLQEHRHLAVQAESVVLSHNSSSGRTATISLSEFDGMDEDVQDDFFDFVAPSGYVPRMPQLQGFVDRAQEESDGTVAGFAQAASTLVHECFRYVKGATQVHSSIVNSLALGAGVCQDFAHLTLGILRMRGLPGRYVSGYLVPKPITDTAAGMEQVIGGQASHAWVEVYVPTLGWVPLDPTLGSPVGLRHIRVAYGRDYGDVPPVRGIYKGHAGQRLSVDVRMRPVLDDEGHELLQGTAARPADPAPEQRQQQPAQQQQ
jgi:transglutaminase-like putative cysteine protease